MLTLFTIPKPFHGHVSTIQRNAIGSWIRLQPECEIILFGNDDGVREAAQEFGVQHVPDVAYNEFGTPLLNSVFELASRRARYSLLTYVNTDIILLSDFLKAVFRVPFRRYLMAGQRWDIDLGRPWEFGEVGWDVRLREYAQTNGRQHPITGMDYFVFPRGSLPAMPPFAVGRPAWDNWLIYEARRQGLSVVDASAVVTAVHQNHDYRHVKQSRGDWQGPEGDRNCQMAGGNDHVFTLDDATWLLGPKWLVPAWRKTHRARWIPAGRVLHPRIFALWDKVVRRLTWRHWRNTLHWRWHQWQRWWGRR